MDLRQITEDGCKMFLEKHTFGHLACLGEDYPYLIPVNYAYDANKLFMFSMPGMKIDYLRRRPLACLQVENFVNDRNWTSVLVQGHFDELPDTPQRRNERIHAWSLLEKRPFWWEPGTFELSSGSHTDSGGPIFFSLSIELMSGRTLSTGSAEDRIH